LKGFIETPIIFRNVVAGLRSPAARNESDWNRLTRRIMGVLMPCRRQRLQVFLDDVLIDEHRYQLR